MKLNTERLEEAIELQSKMVRTYTDRVFGLNIAHTLLYNSNSSVRELLACQNQIDIIRGKLLVLIQRIDNFEISLDFDGEIVYEKMDIEGKNEFARCKRDFISEIFKSVDTIENREWLTIGTEDLMTLANEFLNKLEEAIEEE
ncbi:MAG: hypothetical protein HFJ26_07460 [Clostridia bacterium]|jgi:hypothetical protein|nr:hypothetical protein [Clostridia bacterium]